MADEEGLRIPSFPQLVGGLLIGAAFIAFSIPHALVQFGVILGWPWLSAIGSTSGGILDDVAGATDGARYLSFGYMWSVLLVGLAVYLAALALLSLRHQRFDLFLAGGVSLGVGTAILNILAWVVYLIALLFIVIAIIVAWIFSIIGIIFHAIFSFLAFLWSYVAQFFEFIWGLLLAFWVFLISSPWWIAAALVVLAALIFFAVRFREEFLGFLVFIFWTAVIVGAVFLIRWLIIILAPLWAFLARIFAAIFQFLGIIFRFLFTAIVFLITVFLVGFVIYGIGAWVMDLFRGAWKSGNERRGVIIGALAIGSALAILLLETNLYHTNGFPFYPLQALGIVTYFHVVSPIFDVIMALLVITVSVLGILRNLGQLQEEPTWTEFQSAMVMAALGVIIFVGLYILGQAAGGSSQS
jgi:hypothetical protein